MTRRSPTRRARPHATCATPAPKRALSWRQALAWGGLALACFLVGLAFMPRLHRAAPVAVPPAVARATATPLARAAMTPHPAAALAAARPLPRTLQVQSLGDGKMPVIAPPSVSAALVDRVLAREKSPLAGEGAYIVAEGRRSGVDPAFLLAVVSYFDARDPLPVAAHNVGHIRASGAAPSLNGYHVYASWRAGIAAWYRLIRDQYVSRWGLRTLDAIVPIYAPSSRAGVEAELASLRAMVTAWRGEQAG